MELADAALVDEFADRLSDDPFHFSPRCVLKRRLGRLWLQGSASAPRAAVVVADWLPSEPEAFGTDASAVWSLLAELPGWWCVHARPELAAGLAPRIEAALGTSVHRSQDVYHVLSTPVALARQPAVRRLGEDDLPLLDASPVALRPVGFDSVLAALTGGVVAGAVLDQRLVSVASMATSSETYGDVGVHTLEAWRGRGFATATASLVARTVQERGLLPVWSCVEENVASLRIAEKLGFVEVGRAEYVVAPALLSTGGHRPPPLR